MNYDHRRATTVVKILNADGTPASGAKVSAKLRVHEFLFGIGAFDLMAYLNVPDDMKDKFKGKAERWEALCNYGTLPFYWGRYEPEENGKTGKDGIMKTVDRMLSLGAKVKGHPLCWHTVCADWLMKYDNETIMEKQLGRITREVNDFKGKIGLWDVINETVIMPVFDKYDNAVTRICNHYGRIPLIKKVFDAAHEADPDAVLLINDFNTSEDYAAVIEQCLDAGVPIGAIGIQSHQHQGYWGAEKLERVLARFERFGLPIHFTENTIISGKLMPPEIVDLNDFHADEWPSTPEGEALQCEQIEEMYRILFSHPLVEAITGWELTDGAWLNAPSGLLRRDGTPKPAYDMLMKLIHDEWSTKYDAPADENGVFCLDGFKGEYELVINGKTYKAVNNGSETVIKL
ncbi:MAG: endo-1,4-beta-xylanase [Oscillospiraceae bacterium]|nr:endo-1,4-beta-xylanase [Oscillospiraceae bacterium]